MALEVALLEWHDESGGIRMLGRCRDRDVVEAVRARLAARLSSDGPPRRSTPPRLRPVPDENDAVEE